MPFLEITYYNGDVDRRPLSKQVSLAIGSHATNDIQIEEDDVDTMHCRIGWGKTGYEVTAAGESVDLNGTPVKRATLKPGDVLRVGTVDLLFQDGEPPQGQGIPSSDSLELAPISEELNTQQASPPPAKSPSRKPEPPAPPPKKKAEKPSPSKKSEKPSASKPPTKKSSGAASPASMSAALDALAEESLGEIPTPPKKSRAQRPAKTEPEPEPPQSPSPPADKDQSGRESDFEEEDDDDFADDGLSDRLRQAMRSQQRRPGEEDPLRSPLVLGLTGAAVTLVLAGAIFFFLAWRHSTQQEFDVAKQYYDEGNYNAAITEFKEFTLAHSRNALYPEARKLLGLAEIRQHTDGALPNFEEGLKELREFIREEKDFDNFSELHPQIVELSKKLSLGAAVAGGRQYKPELLEISEQARTILSTHSPKDVPPTETLQQIEQALRTARAEILKHGVYGEHLAEIQTALDKNDPLTALKRRRDLLIRYPAFDRDKKLADLMTKTLAAEKSLVKASELDQAALVEEATLGTAGLTLAFQGRTRTDEVPVGRSIISVAQDCCYGVEFATGEPRWRRVVGFNLPFFPLTDEASSRIYLFDTNGKELVCLDQNDGHLIWRQPIGEDVVGEPLLMQGSLYVATQAGRLLLIDAQRGTLVSALKFSQPIGAPIELGSSDQLALSGNEEVIYTVSQRPFECSSVTYLGQAPHSIEAPLLSVASYLVLVENGTNDSVVKLLKVSEPGQPLQMLSSAPISGRVVDAPSLRGRDLFIPSTGERVSAFTLSDDPGQPPLTAGPAYQGEGQQRGPTFLLTGPDRQLWMATGLLNRLRLTTDALQPEGQAVAPGVAASPLQYLSGYLFYARRRPYSRGVTVTRTDRDELTSDWQAVLGSPVLAWSSRSENALNLAIVNDAGNIFRIGSRDLEKQFLTDSTRQLPLHPDLVTPMFGATLSDGRLAVACGNPEPRLWIINAAGQIEGSPQLPAPPQGAPASVGRYVAVPLEGRVHIVRLSGQTPVQDFALPTGESEIWTSLIAATDEQLVATTNDGTVLMLRLNPSPRPHLAETARIELGANIAYPSAAGEGHIAVADGDQKLSVFDAERLSPVGERTFDAPLTNQPWIVQGRVFVEENGRKLHCLSMANGLPVEWSVDLDQSSLAGLLQQGNQLIVARRDGTVLALDPGTGEEVRRWDLMVSLATGPLAAGELLFVATVDGTLLPIDVSGE